MCCSLHMLQRTSRSGPGSRCSCTHKLLDLIQLNVTNLRQGHAGQTCSVEQCSRTEQSSQRLLGRVREWGNS